jgi:hypothetical protein
LFEKGLQLHQKYLEQPEIDFLQKQEPEKEKYLLILLILLELKMRLNEILLKMI